jgi:ribosome-binding protein aMBF1 (putative translation factor)
MNAKRKNIGGDVVADIHRRMAEDPELAAMVNAEFDRLQLARRVRAAREARGFSQEKLAKIVGTKQPSIARLESGRVTPKLDLLERIASAVGMRLDVRFVPA